MILFSFGRPALQYFCASCSNLLLKTDQIVEWNMASAEECPKCGSLLSSQTVTTSATQQSIVQKPLLFRPKFQTASNLCFDIKKLDSVISLGIGDCVCIIGNHSKSLVERLIISSLLPEKYGGFGSENVIIIDAGNCSDVYKAVYFARQYDLDIRNILRRIVVSRPFTIYQLANLVINELPHVMKEFDAKTIIITDVLRMFLDDPHVKYTEAKNLLKPIMDTVRQFSTNRSDIIVVSFHTDVPSRYSRLLFPNFNKYIQTFAGNCDRITVKVKSRKDNKTIQMVREELEIVQPI